MIGRVIFIDWRGLSEVRLCKGDPLERPEVRHSPDLGGPSGHEEAGGGREPAHEGRPQVGVEEGPVRWGTVPLKRWLGSQELDPEMHTTTGKRPKIRFSSPLS